MEELKGKRKIIKTKITKFKNTVDGFNESTDINEVKLRLEKAEMLWDEFDEVQTAIELLDEAEENYRTSFEEPFYESVSKARKILKSKDEKGVVTTSVAQSSSNAIKIKLPDINLQTFSGNYSDWLMFSDSFISIIDKNEGLNNIQKFQYLRGSLRKDALQVIQSLETTESNYQVAWNLLKNRYENKQLIINTHLKNLFEISAINKETHSNLRQFIDNIRTNMSALRTLQEPVDEWDTVMIYLFTSKLDWRTRKQWQDKLVNRADNSKPSLSMFLEFLTSRSQSLEMSELTTKTDLNLKPFSKKNVAFATTMRSGCDYCQEQHYLFRCEKFLKLNQGQRFEEIKKMQLCANCLKSGHMKRDCRSTAGCKKCNQRHNTLLHRASEDFQIENKQENTVHAENGQDGNNQQSHVTVNNIVQQTEQHVFLPTALVMIFDKQGKMLQARALLDSGSQSNFITKELAQKLGLTCNKLKMEIYGINNKQTHINEHTSIKIKSRFNGFHTTMNCLILEKITERIPQVSISKQRFTLPNDINLADDQFNLSSTIDLLIGSEVFWRVLSNGQIVIAKDKPILQKTVFGWLVTGAYSSTYAAKQVACLSINSSLESQLERFWKIEEIIPTRHWTEEEQKCEEHFKQTFSRNEEGRFIVSLPRKGNSQLGDSYATSLTRFNYLETRLQKNPELKQNYTDFMKQYQELNHMTKIEMNIKNEKEEAFYLPHHPVIKQENLTTKTRVVFDGSHKSSSGKSLNDDLLVGPVIQDDLFSIIFRFRNHHYVITADITMMYRQILVKEEDRDLQRIIWRDEPTEELQVFTLNTVTYGTSAAPYLATRCLQQLALDDGDLFPLAREALTRDFYMDDVLTGTDTKKRSNRITATTKSITAKGKI